MCDCTAYLYVSEDPPYDAYLRKFKYSRALDVVLTDQYLYKEPETTVALFQELIR